MFTLRAMLPEDGPALQHLMEHDPESPGMSMTTCFQVDPYQVWKTLKPQMVGVVAETPDTDELVGVATVAFDDTIQFEGEVRPAAFLENLKVHHDYRGQGLGTQLAQWRIDTAREQFGDQGVIMTGTSSENTASLATMKKWCKQFFEGLVVLPGQPLDTPPKMANGLQVRAPEDHELAAIAEKSNQFYAGYNLYHRLSAETLANLLQTTDPQVYHYRVAVNAAGDLLAGVLISLRGQLMIDELRNVPKSLRMANKVAHLFPNDYRMRLAETNRLWFEDVDAGRTLWQYIRWEFREQANRYSCLYDPRGPLGDVLQSKPWQQPQIQIVLAINGPVMMDDSKLVCGHSRG